VSKILEFVELENFKAILIDKGINAVSVEYLKNAQGAFKGQCRVTVKHEDKHKSLEALQKLNLYGEKLEVNTEKKLQKLDPQAKIYISNLPPSVTAEMFFKTFKNFGHMEACQLKLNADGTCRGFGYVQYTDKQNAS
jgi:RNA recognition motif. (a.k.a. RRM, RBD, or RNP domain)